MKKLILMTAICLTTLVTKAQTVNDIPIKDLDVEFVQIVGTGKMFSTKVTVQIDFGQRTKFFSSKEETFIKDENSERIIFHSMIDALNFMSKQGYQFVTAYAITIGNQNVYHYLLRKENEIEKLERESKFNN